MKMFVKKEEHTFVIMRLWLALGRYERPRSHGALTILPIGNLLALLHPTKNVVVSREYYEETTIKMKFSSSPLSFFFFFFYSSSNSTSIVSGDMRDGKELELELD
jgi:hypothetical protein